MPSIKSAGAGTETTMFAICETARCQVGRHQESLSSSTSTTAKSPKPSALISCCAVSVKLRQGGGWYDILSLLYIAILIYRGENMCKNIPTAISSNLARSTAIIINVGAHIFLSSGSICSFICCTKWHHKNGKPPARNARERSVIHIIARLRPRHANNKLDEI